MEATRFIFLEMGFGGGDQIVPDGSFFLNWVGSGRVIKDDVLGLICYKAL